MKARPLRVQGTGGWSSRGRHAFLASRLFRALRLEELDAAVVVNDDAAGFAQLRVQDQVATLGVAIAEEGEREGVRDDGVESDLDDRDSIGWRRELAEGGHHGVERLRDPLRQEPLGVLRMVLAERGVAELEQLVELRRDADRVERRQLRDLLGTECRSQALDGARGSRGQGHVGFVCLAELVELALHVGALLATLIAEHALEVGSRLRGVTVTTDDEGERTGTDLRLLHVRILPAK